MLGSCSDHQSANSLTIDEAPLSRFHLRLVAYTTGGMFVDGYVLGIVGFALLGASNEFELSSWWVGLLGAAALVGIFLGSLTMGWVTDKLGRQVMYVTVLGLLVAASAAQLLVDNAEQLLVLRLVMGIAIGADYAIGTALLSELVPARHRGGLLAGLSAMWTAGFVAAAVVGAISQNAGLEWRLVLASSAVPALLVLLLRLGTPESPRWLAAHGHHARAQSILEVHWGPGYTIEVPPGIVEDSVQTAGAYSLLFSPTYRRRVAFAGLFWFCQVVPLFAIFTFLPQVLSTLRLDGATGEIATQSFLLAGAIVGAVVMDRIARRAFVIYSFAILAILMGALGTLETWSAPSPVTVAVLFVVFAAVLGAAVNIEFVYPAELFPTRVRATGIGLAAATSRVGAAVGTFLLPTSLEVVGVGPTLLVAACVLLVGLGVSVAWAPETRHVRLDLAAEAVHGKPLRTYAGQSAAAAHRRAEG